MISRYSDLGRNLSECYALGELSIETIHVAFAPRILRVQRLSVKNRFLNYLQSALCGKVARDWPRCRPLYRNPASKEGWRKKNEVERHARTVCSGISYG